MGATSGAFTEPEAIVNILSVTDNRTGLHYNVPVEHGAIRAADFKHGKCFSFSPSTICSAALLTITQLAYVSTIQA